MKPTLLAIEDDATIAAGLQWTLRNHYVVETAATGADALRWLQHHTCDAVLLDLHLPDMDGLDMCTLMRRRGISIPILVLTGDVTIMSKVSLLDAGADDYIAKPFSIGELKARLRAALRRTPSVGTHYDGLVTPGLRLDPVQRSVEREGHVIALRRKEYAILECLMRHAGMVVTRDMLVQYAWGGPDDAWTKTVDVHIKHIRDKVDRPFARKLILTVHGSGYKLDASQSVAVIM